MSPQIDRFSHHTELSRKLLEQSLSGMEQLFTLGIDHTQNFVDRSSQQLRASLADPTVIVETAQWPDAMQECIHGAINLARDTTLAATDYQIDALRLLHNHAAEVQKTLAAAITEQFAIVDQSLGGTPRATKVTAIASKLRA
jgi:hypothetical protein